MREFEKLEPRYVLDSTVVFNEVMYHPPADADESLEWIELYNQLSVDMDVSEWSLRGGVDYDFPDGTIVPGHGFVVVAANPNSLAAASGVSDALGPFVGRLDNAGDSLLLYNNDNRLMNSLSYNDRGDWPVGPDGSGASLAKFMQTTSSEDAENWTTSLELGGTPGSSNFFEDGSIRQTTLLRSRVEATVHVPSDNSLGLDWTEINFNDADWTRGSTGIGYERSSGYDALFGLDLADPPNNQASVGMYEVNQTAYARIPFSLDTDPTEFDALSLRMKFDDGFVAYINGEEVARDNAPETVTWNSGANGSRSDGEAVQFADYDITGVVNKLSQGENVLAIHGLNQSLTSSDFLILPEIVGIEEIAGKGPGGEGQAIAFNEVQAADENLFWLEIANDSDQPVELNGIILEATGLTGGSYSFGPGTLPAGGLLSLTEQELGFHPDDGERLFLYAPNPKNLIDARQVTNRLRGRSEVHDGDWLYPTTPTPGVMNQFVLTDDIVINEIMYHAQPQLSKPGTPATFETTTLLPIDAIWRYNQSGDNLGRNWYKNSYDVDNQAWFSGRGLLGYENETLPEPLRTRLTNPSDDRQTTYYFQTDFQFDGNLAAATDIVLRHVIDDGVIIYLNGEEVTRFNMPSGSVSSTTLASNTVNEGAYSSPISIPVNLLQTGTNVISAELHQGSNNSSDFVFGAEIVVRGELTAATPGIPFTKSDEEWIELYNRSDETIDVSGWKLKEGVNFTFDSNTQIPAKAHVVIASDAKAFAAEFPTATLVGEFSGSLANSGETILLVDTNNNPADRVRYLERGAWPEFADGGGSSLELQDPYADNSKGASWAASNESDKSQWQNYSVSKVTGNDLVNALYNEFIFGLLDSGEFLIDDISVVQAGRELMQNGDFEDDTIGDSPDHWRLIGTHSGTVIIDPQAPANQVLHVVANGAQQHVHDHAETTFVNNTSIRNNAEYTISFRAKWLTGNRQLNNRLYFTRIGNTIELNAPQDNGTPGQPNSTRTNNLGPTFQNLKHAPIIPAANQSTTVTVTAEDPNGVERVALRWNIDGGSWRTVTMSHSGDGNYRGSIPGQSSNRVVQFYIEATDNRGAKSLYPAAGPDSRALYQVRGSSSTTRAIDTFQLVMLSSDERSLFSSVNRMSNNYRGATLIHNGTDVYYNVDARQVGSRFIRPNSGYKIRLNPEQPFYGVHHSLRFDLNGIEEIVYKQMINRTGGSSVSVYDDIAYLISPHSGHTRTILLNLARFEDLFLNEQFENGGDGTKWELDDVTYPTDPNPSPEGLKSGTGVSSPDILDRGTDQEAYRGHLLIKNNRSQDDYSRLVEMAQAIHKSGNALYEATNETMDVDLWMRHYATQAFLGNWDTYGFRRPKNLRVYERPSDRKIIPLAWDYDLANLTEPLIYNGGSSRLDEIRNLPANTRLFWGHLLDLTQRGFNDDYIGRWAQHYGELAGSNFGNETNLVRNRVSLVNSEARSAIPPVSFRISTNGGRDFSVNDNVATLAGTGWIDVREVVWKEAGVPLGLTWTSRDDWQVNLPVSEGENPITLEAYDFAGKLIRSDSITILSTATNDIASSVRITELNFNPHDPTEAELAIDPSLDNDDFEFIEFQNIGNGSVNLLQSRLSNGVEFTFPAAELDAGDYGLVVRDAAAFRLRYGNSKPIIGEFNGKLDNGGESLQMLNASGEIVIDFEYQDNRLWPQNADGIGGTLVLKSPTTTPPSQLSKYYQWQGSTELGGSPGTDSTRDIGIVINEVLAHTDPPLTAPDSIELFNSTNQPIDVSGWFVSDSANDLFKFRIPANTEIAAGGYFVLTEADFNPTPLNPGAKDFALSGAHGDDVWLVQSTTGNAINAFVDDIHFGATANGESMGRVPNGNGRLAPLQQTTFGAANSSTRTGPLVISEIQYSPKTATIQALIADPTVTVNDLEFVEINNPTASIVDLTNWRLRGGIDWEFAANEQLAAGESLVIVPFNPNKVGNEAKTAAFRIQYGISQNVRLVGGFAGQLSNAGERIELQRPDQPPFEEPDFIPHLWEDQVTYDNISPWPQLDKGQSLQRVDSNLFGNEAASWLAGEPSPGSFIRSDVDVDFNGDGVVDVQDVDLACLGIRANDLRFDLNEDEAVNDQDLEMLITDILRTTPGDSNLDRKFNSLDFVIVFSAGQYQDDIVGNSLWSSGDWNNDGEFDTSDLVVAFQAGGYSTAAIPTFHLAAADISTAITPPIHRNRLRTRHSDPERILTVEPEIRLIDLALQSMEEYQSDSNRSSIAAEQDDGIEKDTEWILAELKPE
ncbi:MAG: hypothetical protein GY768_08980 [Planctomycetaceae bacterium]|nr:hypothetical protein [Planctomycetaceae bacterium]